MHLLQTLLLTFGLIVGCSKINLRHFPLSTIDVINSTTLSPTEEPTYYPTLTPSYNSTLHTINNTHTLPTGFYISVSIISFLVLVLICNYVIRRLLRSYQLYEEYYRI